MNVLHTCWLVDDWKASRDRYVKAWRDAGWKVVLWHAGQLRHVPQGFADLRDVRELVIPTFDQELEYRSHAVCADLLRFAILYYEGGSYVDLDVLPNTARASESPLFGESQGCMGGALEIRFVTSQAFHPLIERIRVAQLDNQRSFWNRGGYWETYPYGPLDRNRRRGAPLDKIVYRTGPQLVSRVVKQWALDTNTRFGSYILHGATVDRTPENDGEHLSFRIPEIRQIAKEKRSAEVNRPSVAINEK